MLADCNGNGLGALVLLVAAAGGVVRHSDTVVSFRTLPIPVNCGRLFEDLRRPDGQHKR
jgi:hypothetical protein